MLLYRLIIPVNIINIYLILKYQLK